MNMKIYQFIAISILTLGLLQSCGSESSTATSWDYNNSDNGGFEKVNNYEQETGPGLFLSKVGHLLWEKLNKM